MFRIRRIHDDLLPSSRHAIEQVQEILRDRFPDARANDIDQIPQQLRDPLAKQLRGLLWVAEDGRGRVRGFAYVLHAPDIGLAWLDWISAARGARGGVGGALYERVREVMRQLDVPGIFFECLPDEPDACPNPKVLAENAARLKFYERYGARPIVGTRWELHLPTAEPGDMPPYLVFDNLGQNTKLRPRQARKLAAAILERKYHDLCPPEYVEAVVASFVDDPIALRPPRYVVDEVIGVDLTTVNEADSIVLFSAPNHEIHHVRERGYVETPARVSVIQKELDKTNLFTNGKVLKAPETAITAVHDPQMVQYFKSVCEALPAGKSVYPYVFPIRNPNRKPKDLETRVGYYCIDTFTPLNKNAWIAARAAADCAYSAAKAIVAGHRLAYALVRPPGHHAEYRAFGGFCYLNNAAVAAHELSKLGPVAILDIDYHHGNGQQDIFYRRKDVLTVSIHGHPSFAYPYFCGFADEVGEGEGAGYNLNLPLPETITVDRFQEAVATALKRVRKHHPVALVVSLGLDTAKRDPTGTWPLGAQDFEQVGRMIARAGLPVLVVQEGGYDTRVLGTNARRFLTGLWRGAQPHPTAEARPRHCG